MFAKVIFIFVVIGVFVAGGFAWYFFKGDGGGKDANAPVPVLREAWWSDGPYFSSSTGDYRAKLNLRYDSIESLLLLDIKVQFKNKNGEGSKIHPSIDVSTWAKQGQLARVRTFQYPGEYVYTAILKNGNGESSMILPLLRINEK